MTTVQFSSLCSHLNLGVYLPLLFFSSLFKLSSFLCPPHFTCLAFCLSLAFSLTSLNLYYDVYFSSLRKQARGFGTVQRGSYIGLHLLPGSAYTAFSSSQQRWANPELWWLLSPLLCVGIEELIWGSVFCDSQITWEHFLPFAQNKTIRAGMWLTLERQVTDLLG